MKKNAGLTKYDSLCIKGAAVLMLIFHHLFCEKERFIEYNVSFAPFSQDFAVNVSLLFKVCVSIFAFITGYGLFKSVSRIDFNRKEIFKWNIARLLKTMSGFYFIYIITFIVTQILNQRPETVYFKDSFGKGVMYMITDFLGLAALFNTPTLIATWWYMSAAIIFIIAVPLIYKLSGKIGYLPVFALIIAVPRLFVENGYPGGINPYTFLIALTAGMFFADYKVVELIENRLPKNQVLSYALCFAVFGIIIAFSYYISSRARVKYWELLYGFLPVFYICFFRFCVVRIPVLKNILAFFGKHSMTIFLTHSFIRAVYLEDFTYSFDNFMVITLVLTADSAALAVLLDTIKKFVGYDKLTQKITARLISRIDKINM